MSAFASWITCKSDEIAIDKGCYFDVRAADRVRVFASKFCRHSKGQWAGKSFEFLDWQWTRFIAPLFGWKMPDGSRRYRKFALGVAKKNGKSALLSVLSLYLLTKDDEPGAEVYSAAADRDQASIIYDEAANMVEASPALKARLKVRRSRKTIEYRETRSKFKALSSDVATKEGFNIHGLLFDELHAQSNPDLWDTLKYGGRARRQPILGWISTAGEYDESLLWFKEWERARAIQAGTAVDISTLAVIYEASPSDDWTKRETWEKANPSLGETVNVRQIEEECIQAQHNAADKSKFLRYTLNIATKSDSEWIDVAFWNACKSDFTPADLPGAKCYGGLDLASTTDLIAYVQVFDHEGIIYLWPTFWVPTRAVQAREKSNKQRYNDWIEQGYLVATSNEPVADYNVIRRDITKLCGKYPTDKVLIDKWNGTQLAYNLRTAFRKRGLTTKLQFATFNTRTVSAATKEMERLIIAGKLRHPGNPVLDWMFGNVIIKSDAFDNRMPDKSKSKDKIDGIAASVLALAVMIEEQKEKSAYERKKLQGTDDESKT